MKYSKSAVIFGVILCLLTSNSQIPPKYPLFSMAQARLQQQERQSTLVRGVYGDLTLNPQDVRTPEQWAVLRDLFEGLAIYDAAGNVMPAVAEKWQSADQKNWFISLRPQAKWSNSEKLTAHDFVRAWQQLALSANPLKSYLGFMNLANAEAVMNKTLPVEQLGVKALDERTLKLTLDKPTPYLPKMLAHVALFPRYTGNETGMISNGAYQFSAQQENHLYLSQNPYYWRADKVAFKRVDYQKIDASQSVHSLDFVENVQQKTEKTQQFPQLCSYFYEFNFNHPLLKENAIRQALVSMISPNTIVTNEYLPVIPSNDFLPQNMQFEDENSWSPVVIETLLQQHKISEKNPLVLRLSYDQNSPYSGIANRLIQAWSQSDLIQIKAQAMDKNALLEKRAEGDFDIIRSGWCADYNDPAAFLSLLYSHSPDNKMHYNNPKVDNLLAQSFKPAISAEKRTALYQQIAQIISDDFVFLPIFQYTTPFYIDRSIRGYQTTNPTGVIYSKDLFRQ